MIWSFTDHQKKVLEALTYSRRKRILWIAEQVHVFGGVGYANINLKFSISRKAAEDDFYLASELFGLRFDRMIKRWVATPKATTPIEPSMEMGNTQGEDHD